MNIKNVFSSIEQLSNFYSNYNIDVANKKHAADRLDNRIPGSVFDKITIGEYKFIRRLSVDRIHLIAKYGEEKLQETINVMMMLK